MLVDGSNQPPVERLTQVPMLRPPKSDGSQSRRSNMMLSGCRSELAFALFFYVQRPSVKPVPILGIPGMELAGVIWISSVRRLHAAALLLDSKICEQLKIKKGRVKDLEFRSCLLAADFVWIPRSPTRFGLPLLALWGPSRCLSLSLLPFSLSG